MADLTQADLVAQANAGVADPALLGFAPLAPYDPPAPQPSSPFKEGIQSGIEGLKGSFAGAGAAVAGGFGAKGVEQKLLDYSKEREARAGETSRRVEDVDSIGSGFDYAKWALGSVLPSSLTFLTAATVGRGLGALATRNAAVEATKNFAKTAGAAVGGLGASAAMEVGQIYPNAIETGVENPVARSIIGGVAAGSLDAVSGYLILRRLGMFGPAEALRGVVGKGGIGGALKTAAKDVPITMFAEGGQEVAQTGIERYAAGQKTTGPEAMSDYINSFFPGMIGGTMSIPGSLYRGFQGPQTNVTPGENTDVSRGTTDLQQVPATSVEAQPSVLPQVSRGVPAGAPEAVPGTVTGGPQTDSGAVLRQRVPEAGATGPAAVPGLPGTGAEASPGLGQAPAGGVAVPGVSPRAGAFGNATEAAAAKASLVSRVEQLAAELKVPAKEREKGRTKQAITKELKAASSAIDDIDTASPLLPTGEGAPIEQHAPYLNAVAERNELTQKLRTINARLEAANQLKPEFREDSPAALKDLSRQAKDTQARLDTLERALKMVGPQKPFAPTNEAPLPSINDGALPNFPVNEAEAGRGGLPGQPVPAANGDALMRAARPRLDREIANTEQALKQRRDEVEAAYAQREGQRNQLARAAEGQAADQNLERDIRVGNAAGVGEGVDGALQAELRAKGLVKDEAPTPAPTEPLSEKQAREERLRLFGVQRVVRNGDINTVSDEDLYTLMNHPHVPTSVRRKVIKELGARLEFEQASKAKSATPSEPAQASATETAPAETPEEKLTGDEKPETLTRDQYRTSPAATRVPKGVLTVDLSKETAQSLKRFSNNELSMLLRVMNEPISGTKAKMIERIMAAFEVRTVLKDATVASLNEKRGDELKALLKKIGKFVPGKKNEMAKSLIGWRDTARKMGAQSIADAKHRYAVTEAVMRGDYVSPEVLRSYPELAATLTTPGSSAWRDLIDVYLGQNTPPTITQDLNQWKRGMEEKAQTDDGDIFGGKVARFYRDVIETVDERNKNTGEDLVFKERYQKIRNDPFLKWIDRTGGIDSSYASDLTGEKGFRSNMLFPGIFKKPRKNSSGIIIEGVGLDDIATRAIDEGFMSPNEGDDVDGGVAAIAKLLQDAFQGKRPVQMQNEDEMFSALREKYMEQQLADEISKNAVYQKLAPTLQEQVDYMLDRYRSLFGEDQAESLIERIAMETEGYSDEQYQQALREAIDAEFSKLGEAIGNGTAGAADAEAVAAGTGKGGGGNDADTGVAPGAASANTEDKRVEQPRPAYSANAQTDTWSGPAYRALNYNPPKGATVADIVRYEAEELGNEDIGKKAAASAAALGIDLSKIPATDAIWVTHTKQQAKFYGEPKEVKNVDGWHVLVDIHDGGTEDQGALLIKPGVAEKASTKTDTPEFRKWFDGSKIVDKDGNPLIVYHGTTADFESFDRSRGSKEADFGAGFYFTNTKEDMAHNYAGIGPDLTNKVTRRAEQIYEERFRDKEEPVWNSPQHKRAMAAAKKKAAKEFGEHKGVSMPVYLAIKNPLVIGGKDDTYLDYEINREDEDNPGEPTGKLAEFMVALKDAADSAADSRVDDLLANLESEGFDGGMRASELVKLVKADETFGYSSDEEGNLISSEILREALQASGFDGIIDHTVNDKFGTGKFFKDAYGRKQKGNQMPGMHEKTVHYIAFEPTQIKSAIGNNGEYDANEKSIVKQQGDLYSANERPDFDLQGETPAQLKAKLEQQERDEKERIRMEEKAKRDEAAAAKKLMAYQTDLFNNQTSLFAAPPLVGGTEMVQNEDAARNIVGEDVADQQDGAPPSSIEQLRIPYGDVPTGKTDMARKFRDLADMQRGAPESAMNKAQHAMGGGVLGHVLEHGGDVVHRMNEFMTWAGSDVENIDRGRAYVLTKTEKVLDTLKSRYGFRKEHEENLRNNADYYLEERGTPKEKYNSDVASALADYASEHGKLPSYNEPQRMANEAAVALGKGEFEKATNLYQQLHDLALDKDKYTAAMLDFKEPPNPQTQTKQFKKWFGDSVVTITGKPGDPPLAVYRGEHGETNQEIHSRLGSVSFGNKDAANTYAMDQNVNGESAEAPRVVPAYLSIKNPVIHNLDDPFIDFEQIAKAIGKERAIQIAKELRSDAEYTGRWMEELSKDYDSPEAYLRANPDKFAELYLDAFHVFDEPKYVKWFKAAGYDGAIHLGNGETATEPEYKVFSLSQIKSAVGNNGEFNPAKKSIIEAAKPAYGQKSQTETAQFKKWFGNSVATKDEKPGSQAVPFFHGTASDVAEPSGSPFWVTNEAPVAKKYADRAAYDNATYGDDSGFGLDDIDEYHPGTHGVIQGGGQNIMPLYVKAEKPIDLRSLRGSSSVKKVFAQLQKLGVIPKSENVQDVIDFIDNPDATSVYQILQDLGVYRDIQKKGFDSVWITDVDTEGQYHDSLGVFNPDRQVKSAVGNNGDFNPTKPSLVESADAPYEKDLFGNALSTPEQDLARTSRLIRQPQPVAPIEGARFGAVVEPVKVGSLKSGFAQINVAQEAAHAIAEAFKGSPQEKFMILALDANQVPISVIHVSTGGVASAFVPEDVVAKAVYQTPNVASIWYAHNHPGGVSKPSDADKQSTIGISRLFGQGTGVAVAGHVIIARGKFSELDANGNPTVNAEINIPQIARSTSIPIMERVVKVDGALGKDQIINPHQGMRVVNGLLGNKPGIVFVDSVNRPVAALNMSAKDMAALRSGMPESNAKKFFFTAGKSNAAGLFVSVPKNESYGNVSNAVFNMAGAANASNIHLLDFYHGDVSYAANKLLNIPNDTFNSRDAVTQAYDDRGMRYEAIGQEIISYLNHTLGGSPDLQVGLFEQRQPGGFAGRISMSAAKDIIQIALNAKTPLSVAAHEGFHRIEMRHLNGQDRAVVARGTAKSTALYARVLEIAREYDQANGTELADEIAGNEHEARAYAFQFWKEGKVQAEGMLGKVFEKIRQFLERISNYMAGYGFKSIDDIFEAVERGAYAKSENGVFVQTAREAYGELEDLARDLNSKAATSAAQTNSPEFKKWFGDSAVTVTGKPGDAPLEVFHGSQTDFTVFEPGRAGAMYFTPRRDHAVNGYGPKVIAAYLRINKLADLTDTNSDAYKFAVKAFNDAGGWASNEDAMEGRSSPLFDPALDETWEMFDNPETDIGHDLLKAGYDGVKLNEYGGDVSYAVYKPTQIKSSIGNNGNYDPADANILHSNAALEAQSILDISRRVQAGELPNTQLMDAIARAIDRTPTPASLSNRLFNAAKESFVGGIARAYMSHFSTGNNIARYSKGYKNVFDVVSAYGQSKSRSIAANLDIGMSKWKPWDVNVEDSRAAGHFLMERTSKNLKADSPEYMLAYRKLTKNQRDMVDQANATVPAMLMAEFEADKAGFRESLNDEDYASWEANRKTQIQRLIDEGYVPERRYGNFGVSISMPITNKDGVTEKVQLRYDMFESQINQELWFSSLMGTEKEPGPLAGSGLTIEKGMRFKPEYDASLSFKQFLDIANRHGVSLTQQEREKIAKAMITADSTRRNRIFQRQNIPGYSEDATRVLAEFIVNVSNKVAYAEYGNAIQDAIAGKRVTIGWVNGKPTMQIDQNSRVWSEDGENSGYYHGEAEKMVNAVIGPQEEQKWTRLAKMGATMGFLGGSIAFVPVQLSSIPINVIPHLTKSTSYTNAAAVAFGALSNTVSNSGTLFDLAKLADKNNKIDFVSKIDGLRDALIRAGEDGTTFDTELYQLMGMTRGGLMTNSRVTQKAMELWMKPFTWSEKANRISTFIAAYKIGMEKGPNGPGLAGDELYKFAQQTVFDTQIRYDLANRPAIMRNPIYALLFTFKTYPIAMGELIWNLFKEDKRAGVAMLGSLWMFAGLNGLPFRENLLDLIDTLAQRMFGAPFNSQRWLRNHLKHASEAMVGVDLSGVALNGLVNSFTDLNMQSRVGLHNLIPGTRIAAMDTDWTREATQILGPIGSQAIGLAKGTGSFLKGDFVEAMQKGGPTAVQNVIKGIGQFQKGYAVDAQGQKLQDVNMFNAAMQTIGFSNASLASAYDKDRIDKQTWAMYTAVRSDFIKDITKAVQSGDSEKVHEITSLLSKWNEQNPDMPIKLDAGSLRRHIQQAGMSIEKRTLLRLPERLRARSMSQEEALSK